MRKEKFIYNTHTLRYEKVQESLSAKVSRYFGIFCAIIFTSSILTVIAYHYFPSPEHEALQVEVKLMEQDYQDLMAQFALLSEELENLQDRDAYAHRMIFGMAPIDEGVWEGGIGGHDEYEKYRDLNAGKTMAAVRQKADKLKRQMYIQSKSLDTVINLARQKEDMLASIPSIKPVRSDKLPRGIQLLSGFGRRIHPIYKVPRMHWGIDFTAPKNTPIQATGAGVVKRVEHRSTGYGKNVVIDHGFGYETLYGHMSRIDVKRGQRVTRGQQIGLVGSTGTSTAPHCHYEVLHMNKKVNPIHYCMDGLTPEEYQELVKAAEMSNQSMD